jgi:HEAT repeat protein
MRLKQWLARLVPIYPGEGPAVWLCLTVNFLVFAGIMYGRNARDSLFLSQFGVQYLPHMYFANAVVLVICSLFYTSLVDRIDRGKFLASISVIFVTLLLASRIILLQPRPWFCAVLYILAQAVWNFSLLQFWTFLGDLFDSRQAKRLFPLIAIGSLLGMIAVGLTSRPLVRAVGTENILLVWAGLISGALVLGGVVYKTYRKTKEAPAQAVIGLPPPTKLTEWEKFKDGASRLQHEPLLRTMALITFLLWTVFTVVDFCFNGVARARYPDKNELTAFLGSFRGWAGFLCLIVQMFLTSPLIRRLGVGATIAFHPTFLTLSTLWMSLRFGFISVCAAKMGDHVLLYTLQDSSFQLLYNPVPLELRARMRGFIDGYVKPLSMAAAGVLLLLGTRYLAVSQVSKFGVVLAVAWLAIALTAKRGYIHALLRNLQGESPALRQAAAQALKNISDPSSLAIVYRTLLTGDPSRIIAALHFLERYGGPTALDAMAALLTHPDAHVRATAASALGRRAAATYQNRLLPLLKDADARVRANAVDALASSGNPAVAEPLRPLLPDSSTRVRVNTVLALASLLGIPVSRECFPMIRVLAGGDSEARFSAIYALGRLNMDESRDLLCLLLNDPSLRIRTEAAKALGQIGTPQVIPSLLEALAGPPELRHAARHSLGALVESCGGETTQTLILRMQASENPQVRSELVDVLGRLKDPAILDTLTALLKDPEWRVRWKVLTSFERWARLGPLPERYRATLFDYTRDEMAFFRHSLLCSQALVPQRKIQGDQLLALTLEEDQVNIEERVFHVLGILCGREQMLAIFEKLNSRNPRLKADALEALDNLAPKDIGRELLNLLEPSPVSPQQAATDATLLLASLANHPKPWLRACAAHYLGYHPELGTPDILKALLQDPASMVRETALDAGWKAFKDIWQPQLEHAIHSSDTVLKACAQRILAASNASRSPTERSPNMLLTVEKVLFLDSAPLFAGLSGEELAALAQITLEQEYQPDEVLFEEGQHPDHLYIIVSGKVEVFHRVGERERPVAYLGEKECVGEMAILDDEPRSASVKAVEPTLALKVDRDSFRELILERPQISFAIFKILSGRLRHKQLEADNVPAFDSTRQVA